MDTRRIAVTTTASRSALQRIITTCTRYQCTIVAMSWAVDEQAGHLRLEVSASPYHLRGLPDHIGALVEVLNVVHDGADAREEISDRAA